MLEEVKARAFAYLILGLNVPGCFVYDDSLVSGGRETGGRGNTGGASGGNSNASGGRTSDGGTAPDGGAGGETGGAGGEEPGSGGTPATGGMTTDGGSGGGPSGGAGGTPSGGADSGTGGAGGFPPGASVLVDDLESGPTYFNDPFAGGWTRYGQTDTAWTATNIAGMIVAEGGSNHALLVKATFPMDDWGIDVVITLRANDAFDVSPFAGFSFRAKANVVGDAALRMALEDAASHRGSSLCNATGTVGANCDKHAESLATKTLTNAWVKYDIPLSSFGTGCGPGCTARTVTLDRTKVYSIHFKMDPVLPQNSVDFLIDDIFFYTAP